jgi:general secretion pathway protein A
MYEPFFGLCERPFDLAPNPRFLFLTPRQREALSNLRYGLTTPRGLTLLLGDAGTGKTTLVQTMLSELESTPHRLVLLSNPTLTRPEFYEYLACVLGLGLEAAASKARFLHDLREDLRERFAQGCLTAIIVDEAQSLPYELLEEIRLLGNSETPTEKLLNIVLAGQPELATRLNEPSLRQLKQRISLRCELRPFDLVNTASYIAGRLRIAGGKPTEIFTKEAVTAIYEASAGLPRTINVICDNALIGGFAAHARPVTAQIVAEVCRDFDLQRPATQLAEPSDGEESFPAETRARDDEAESATVEAVASGTHGSTAALFKVVSRKRRFYFFP